MLKRLKSPRLTLPLLLGALPLIAYGCGGDDPTSPNNNDDPTPKPTFAVTVTVSGDGTGTVTSSPAGISCTKAGGTCSATYDQGTSVTLTGTPDTGFMLGAWAGACSGAGACSFTVTAATEVSADFDDPTVETMMVGAAGGAISSPDGAVALTIPGGALSSDVEITVRETDVADLDAAFVGYAGTATSSWEMGPSGTLFSQPITVEWRMPDTEGPDSVAVPLLATLKDGAIEVLGGGSVRREGGEIIATGMLDHFTPVVVYDGFSKGVLFAPATAVVGQPFEVKVRAADWFGLLSAVQWRDASGAPIAVQGAANLSMSKVDATSVSGAYFEGLPQYVCGAIGTGVIVGTVHLTTKGSSPFGDLTLDALRATVECTGVPTKRLTITKSGTGTGGVSSAPAGIDCGDTCAFDFTENLVVTLTATPDAGSTFCGWTAGSAESASVVTVTMSADATVDACFNAIPVPTEVSIDANSVSSNGGVVAAGTQTVNLTDGGTVVGTVPVTFSPPTFVGSSPARFGFGQNGWVLIDLANAVFPGGFPGLTELTLRICGVNNSAQADLRVENQDAAGTVQALQTLTLLNTCIIVAVSELLKVVMVTNIFYDLTMAIVRPASSQTEMRSGPPPELLIG